MNNITIVLSILEDELLFLLLDLCWEPSEIFVRLLKVVNCFWLAPPEPKDFDFSYGAEGG